MVAVGATARRELPVPGRDLAGIYQAMEYLPLANRACAGDYGGLPPIHADGLHVVIVGGGDTGADCLGTVLRQRAASVIQLDINPLPGNDRPPHQPWPVYPKVYRVSAAHEEARELAGLRGQDWEGSGVPVAGPDGDVRVFSASTFRFEGNDNGHVRALHLVGVEPQQRRPLPGTEQVIPADLVLLALGFSGPERDNGLMEQLPLRLNPHGNFARGTDFSASPDGVSVAGDAGRGQSLIVWALAEGRAAAAAVDRYLMGSTIPQRAAVVAEGDAAVHAAPRLRRDDRQQALPVVDLVPVPHPLPNRAAGAVLARGLEETGRVTHGALQCQKGSGPGERPWRGQDRLVRGDRAPAASR